MSSLEEEQSVPTPSPRRSRQNVDVRGGDFSRAAFGDQTNQSYMAPVTNVDVFGGDLSGATLGDKTITTTTVHKYYDSFGSVDAQSDGDHGLFEIKHTIRVYEEAPINADSRVFRGALVSSIIEDQDIVVKILSNDTYAKREAAMHFHIPSHPNIVHPICADAFKYRGQSCIYVALELCDPLNLHDYIKKLKTELCPFPTQLMVSYAQQTSEGVAFLHRHKIINRDLKPQNILLTTDKTVIKICDFGLSKLMTRQDGTEHTRIHAGTSGWKSPEVLRGDKQISTSADVFSLGLIHYFLMSYGDHAFGNDEIARDLNIRDNKHCRLNNIHIQSHEAAILFIIKKQLCPFPNLRPSAEEVKTNFTSVLFSEFLHGLEPSGDGSSTSKRHVIGKKTNDDDAHKRSDQDNPPHHETSVLDKIGSTDSPEDEQLTYEDYEVLSRQDLSSFLHRLTESHGTAEDNRLTEDTEFSSHPENAPLHESPKEIDDSVEPEELIYGDFQHIYESVDEFEEPYYAEAEISSYAGSSSPNESPNKISDSAELDEPIYGEISPPSDDTPSFPAYSYKSKQSSHKGTSLKCRDNGKDKNQENVQRRKSTPVIRDLYRKEQVGVNRNREEGHARINFRRFRNKAQDEERSENRPIQRSRRTSVKENRNREDKDVMIIKTRSSTEDQLYNELKIMKMLTHENIIKVIRPVARDVGKPFHLELENMTNGNLRGYLFKGGIQYSKILEMASQVADGMAYVASKDIVHRDLRAHNIYVNNNNICKIGGFHFARVLQAGVYICEEPEEIPEKWTDPDFFESFIYTKKSDVWSFGMFLVEIITRKHTPYPSFTTQQIRNIYKKGEKLPRLPRVTPGLYEIMLDCWDNIRQERPTFIELENKLKKLF